MGRRITTQGIEKKAVLLLGYLCSYLSLLHQLALLPVKAVTPNQVDTTPDQASIATPAANSTDERVVVRAEGSIQIMAGGKEIIAQDGVQIQYRDMVIYSDWLHYLARENIAQFRGHVQIEQEGQ